LRRDDHDDLAADLLPEQAGVPALDDLPGAGLEGERGAARPRGVEGRAVPQPAAVLDEDVVALLDLLALALDRGGDDELGGGVAVDGLDARLAVLGERDGRDALGGLDGGALGAAAGVDDLDGHDRGRLLGGPGEEHARADLLAD